MSDIQAPLVGPRNVADGAEVRLRSERTGGLVVQPAHGEMYEESARGNVWTISTAIAGVAVTANVVISTASARAIVGLFNPTPDSNFHITRVVIEQVAGTAATGGLVWGTIANPTGITGAGVSGRNNKTFVSGGHKAKAFDGSTDVTGAAITVPFRYIGGFMPGAIGAGQATTLEEVEEDLIIGPGCFAGVYSTSTATGTTIVASLSWAEIPT